MNATQKTEAVKNINLVSNELFSKDYKFLNATQKKKVEKTIEGIIKIKKGEKAVTEKAILKAVSKKVVSNGLHKALLECNKLDKLENQSLSGALKRLKVQIELNSTYAGIDTNLLNEAFSYDNLLANVSNRCIETKKFSVYSLGLAVNKFLKPLIKK
jgi:hypothetical protein